MACGCGHCSMAEMTSQNPEFGLLGYGKPVIQALLQSDAAGFLKQDRQVALHAGLICIPVEKSSRCRICKGIYINKQATRNTNAVKRRLKKKEPANCTFSVRKAYEDQKRFSFGRPRSYGCRVARILHSSPVKHGAWCPGQGM